MSESVAVCSACGAKLRQEMCCSGVCEWVCPKCGLVWEPENKWVLTFAKGQTPEPLSPRQIPLKHCLDCGGPIELRPHRAGRPSYRCETCRLKRRREAAKLRQRRHRTQSRLAVTLNQYVQSVGTFAAEAIILEAILVSLMLGQKAIRNQGRKCHA